MKVVCCESCGEQADDRFNPLKSVQIDDDRSEQPYMLCRTCREKLRRILDGHGL